MASFVMWVLVTTMNGKQKRKKMKRSYDGHHLQSVVMDVSAHNQNEVCKDGACLYPFYCGKIIARASVALIHSPPFTTHSTHAFSASSLSTMTAAFVQTWGQFYPTQLQRAGAELSMCCTESKIIYEWWHPQLAASSQKWCIYVSENEIQQQLSHLTMAEIR